MPFVLEGLSRNRNGSAQRLIEGNKIPFIAFFRRQFEQGFFPRLNLVLPGKAHGGAKRAVHHVFTNINQLAADPRIMNGASVISGVDNPDHGGQQLGHVGHTAHAGQNAGMFQFGPHGYGVCQLSVFNAPGNGFINLAIHTVGKMLTSQKVRNAVIGAVVRQQRAKQRLFGLHIGRGLPKGKGQKAFVLLVGGICCCHAHNTACIRFALPRPAYRHISAQRFLCR